MKLFVIDKSTNQKVYLNLEATSRDELFHHLGSRLFLLENKVYNINDVVAESNDSGTSTGAVVGGLIGILAGPIGILGGGLLGGLIGNETDKAEKEKVVVFNQSKV